jgi:hypothetical protein
MDHIKALHPPKPGLALRVGFAGARKGFDPHRPHLRKEFTDVLSEIRQTVEEIHKTDSKYFAPEKPPRLIFVCSLAAGADLFAANLALDAGYELQVPLAMHRDAYANANFQGDENSRAEFEGFMSRASSVFELPGTTAEDDTYDAAGTVLVNHSDMLVTIWDMSAGHGRGGTADSVEKAKMAGIPVVAFHSKDRTSATVHYRGRIDVRPAELRDILPQILYDGLQKDLPGACRPWDRDSLDDGQCRKLTVYYKETEHRMDWGLPYSLLISLIRSEWDVRWRRSSFAVQANSNWGKLDGETRADKARDFFRPLDQWADCLALYYSQWMRGVVATSVVGGGLFVSTTLAQKLWPHFFSFRHSSRLEVIPYLILFLIVISRGMQVNRRWLDYRTLSELLRNHALCSAIGGLQKDRTRFHLRYGFAPTWIRFYFQAAVREFGLCSAVVDDEYLRNYKHLLSTRIYGQIRYHHAQASKCGVVYRRIRWLGVFAAIFSLAAPVLARVSWLAQKYQWDVSYLKLREIDSVPFIFAIITASIAAFAAQENFQRLAQVSDLIMHRLDLLWRVVNAVPLDCERLRTLTGEAIDITIQEHAGWNAVTSMREIEISAG